MTRSRKYLTLLGQNY